VAVHEVARVGFGDEADAYERARPSYPPDAVAWLVEALRIGPHRLVADVAAGTGKFTRLLLPSGATVVAVEPVPTMAAHLPDVPRLAAVAEALPFGDGTLDALTVAQAFHWFDARAALAEFHRVLRPGGRVGLIWNARDRSAGWVDAIWSIMDSVEKRAPWRDHDSAGESHDAAFDETPFFTQPAARVFHQVHELTPELVVERIRSVSHVAVLPAGRQADVLDAVREVLRTDPGTAGRDLVAMPYRVDAYWAERLPT
jgi:SAM-dependent methyltransferase